MNECLTEIVLFCHNNHFWSH